MISPRGRLERKAGVRGSTTNHTMDTFLVEDDLCPLWVLHDGTERGLINKVCVNGSSTNFRALSMNGKSICEPFSQSQNSSQHEIDTKT